MQMTDLISTFSQQIGFLFVLFTTGYLLNRRVQFIKKSINLGKAIEPKPKSKGGLKNMLLMALGQKRMFDKPIVAIFHLIIYVGFILINIEVLEIILDGLLGTHRLFASFLGSFYKILINFFEILAFGVFLACVLFLYRRNILKIGRFEKIEMKGWPKLDANLILFFEICLVIAILKLNAVDSVLQLRSEESKHVGDHFPQVGSFIISQFLMVFYKPFPTSILIIIERFTWWFHILGILAFAVYITYSKHLHLILGLITTYRHDSLAKNKITTMPDVTKEVKALLNDTPPETEEELPTMGAKDVPNLYKKNILDAFACSECGRCTESCPANLTGKKLSPRKIMMDTRDRAEEITSLNLSKQKKNDSKTKTLYGDYISKEELMACTTCNACVEVCPLNLNPLNIIMSLRRYVAMEESGTPAAWNMMFQNIETNTNPWGLNPAEREEWMKEN